MPSATPQTLFSNSENIIHKLANDVFSSFALLLPSNENVLLPSNNSIFTLSACFDILLKKEVEVNIYSNIVCKDSREMLLYNLK